MTAPQKPEAFDLEAAYDAEIYPLMAQIIAVCKRVGMPVVASFAYRGDGEGDYDLCTTNIPVPKRTPEEFKAFASTIYRPGARIVALTIVRRGKGEP